MRTRLVLSAMAALVMGSEAMADGVSYSYVQGNLLLSALTQNHSVLNGSGLGFDAGAGIGSYLFAFGSLSTNTYSAKFYDLDTGSHVKIKLVPGTLGAGGHLPLFSSLDVLVSGSRERTRLRVAETDHPVTTETYNGWGATLGLRGWFSDSIQWDIFLKYSDIGDLKTVLGYSFSGRYYFKSAYSFGVNVSGRHYDDKALNVNESIVGIVFRYDFDVHY